MKTIIIGSGKEEKKEIVTAADIFRQPETILQLPDIVMVRFNDSEVWEDLFNFYSDEIDFTPAEFLGLTRAEAKYLKVKKDTNYLRN